MAKTTSQIQAEKKKLQESFAPTEKKLSDTHAKQMAKIGYTPEKEHANLAAARESNKRREQNVAAQAAKKAKQEANKTAVDKMWDRQNASRKRTEEDEAVSAIAKARRNTEQKKKELEEYQNTEYDWTDAAARELYEKGQKQKEAEISKAQAEQNAAVANFDRVQANFDRVQMNAMSEEDRGLIDEYIRREDTASDPIDTGTAAIVEHFVNQNGGIDEKRLKQLVETRRRELNAQRMQETQEKAQEAVNSGDGSAVLHNALTVPANLIAGAMGTMSYIHDYFNQDERYSGLDPNSMGNQLNVYSGAVRGQTQQNIVGTEEERAAQIASLVEKGYGRSEAEFIVNKGRQGLGALYQSGMSYADTFVRAVVGGALGLGAGFGATVAGLNTFSQTMSDASARGATPEQALALAVTTAGIEAATEKIPLDNLIKVSKGGGAKSLIKNILRQYGIEATEEEASLIGTTLADAAIMQEKSEYNLSVAAYMASGMNEEQARGRANWDLIAEAGETFIVSGFSGALGGLSASAAAAFNRDGLDTAQQGAQQAQVVQNQQDVNVEGQAENDGLTDAQRFARDAQRGIEETGAQEAQKVPKAEPEVKSEGLQHFENGVQEVLGMNPPNEQITPKERGLRYKASKVNSAILDMVDRVKKGLTKGSEKVPLGTVSDSNAAQIQRETGIDTKGYEVAIEARQIQHILNRHGENGTANHSMADPNDIARIEYALNNPDRITKSDPTNAYVTVKDGKMKPSDTVLYETRLEDGSYYVVQAVPETKKKTLYVLSAFIGDSNYKNEAPQSIDTVNPGATPKADSTVTAETATQSIDTVSPGATPKANSAGTSTGSVPQIGTEVNHNSENTEISDSTTQADTRNMSAQEGQEIPEGMKGTGAAEQNFSGKAAYQDLLTDENAQRDRSTGVRPVEVPKVDANGKRVTEFAGNVYSAKVTPDSTANAVESLIQDGKLGFDTRTNQQSLENARQAILDNGPDTILREIASNAENNVIRDGDVEKAMVLYAAYANDPEMQDPEPGRIYQIGVRRAKYLYPAEGSTYEAGSLRHAGRKH